MVYSVWLCTIYWKFCVDLCVVDVEITLPVWDIAHHVMRRNVTGVPVWRHIRSKDPLERCGPHGEPSGVGVSKDPPSVPNGKSWQSSQEYQGKHSLGTWKCKSVFYIHCRIISRYIVTAFFYLLFVIHQTASTNKNHLIVYLFADF